MRLSILGVSTREFVKDEPNYQQDDAYQLPSPKEPFIIYPRRVIQISLRLDSLALFLIGC